MKKQVKSFICFYLTVPLFVLANIVLGGIMVRGSADTAYIKEEIPENIPNIFLESELFPSEMLNELPYTLENMHPIIAKTIKSSSNILNETSYNIEENNILKEVPTYSVTDEPLVLVVHTHGTECYFSSDEGVLLSPSNTEGGIEAYYGEKTKTRSEECERNVVSVGDEFCETLESAGIKTIHCREMFDRDDYTTAYSKSGNAIEKYLKEYPSIQLVIDLHRDSLMSEDFVKIKTVTSGLEERCAQIMIVAGSDAGGSYYPQWRRNLALDLKIKEKIDSKYPSLSRPIFFRGARYNQHLPYTSFLLEVGTCSNTLEEAKTAARLCAECIAEVILSL